MNWFTKKITVPESNATKEVDAIQLWEVRWYSLHSKLSSENVDHVAGREELEAFPTEQEARDFATALTNAFALTRRSVCIKPTVTKAR